MSKGTYYPYKILNIIDNGGYGNLLQVENEDTKKQYAMKVVNIT